MMKRLSIAGAVGVALVAGLLLFAADPGVRPTASAVSPGPGEPAAETAAAQRTVALKVYNMYCATCPFIVRRAFERTPGVIAAKVSYREKRALVTFDEAKTSVADLIRATSDAGYPAEVLGGEG